MIDPRDPTRLSELDPLLREAFDHARNEQPSVASVDAVVRGVEQAALGAGAAGGAANSLAAKLAMAKSGVMKIAVILGVSSGLLWAAHSYRAATARTRAQAIQTDDAAVRARPATSMAPLSATSDDPRPLSTQPRAAIAAAAAREADSVQSPADRGDRANRRPPQRWVRAEASDANKGVPSSASGALRALAARRADSNAKPETRTSRAAESPDATARARAVSELALLEEAQQALRSSPERALDLTDRHSREYSHGVFVQEREQIAIEALYASGRTGAMRARALRFQRSFPGSAHNARIAELLGSSQ
jgi:hypothetical protein